MNIDREKLVPAEPINLVEFFGVLWRGKWLLLSAVLLSVGLGVVYAFTAQRWYRAEVLLKLADTKSAQSLGSQLNGLGSLASFAGLSTGNDPSAESIAVLTSREFTAAFIRDENLLPVLFANKWDRSAKRWKTSKLEDQPDVRDGIKYFDRQVRTVVGDKKTGLIRMVIEWKDAATAASWANLLVERANELMRKRALTEAQNNVNYLKQELTTSNLVPIQQSIGKVLETELQKLMLANVNREFAFKFIDHAEPPKWRSRPQLVLILAGSFFCGLIFPAMFLIGCDVMRRSRDGMGATRQKNSDELT